MFEFLKKKKDKLVSKPIEKIKYFKATSDKEIIYLSANTPEEIQSLLFKHLIDKSILNNQLDDQQENSEMDIIQIKRKDLKSLGLKKVKESKILRVDKIK